MKDFIRSEYKTGPSLTIKELKKAIENLPDNMLVYFCRVPDDHFDVFDEYLRRPMEDGSEKFQVIEASNETEIIEDIFILLPNPLI